MEEKKAPQDKRRNRPQEPCVCEGALERGVKKEWHHEPASSSRGELARTIRHSTLAELCGEDPIVAKPTLEPFRMATELHKLLDHELRESLALIAEGDADREFLIYLHRLAYQKEEERSTLDRA